MADFSQYGGPSTEWLEVEKTLPALTFDLSTPVKTLQQTVNGTREEASAKIMETLNPKVHILNHTIPTRDGSSIEARSYRPVTKKASEKLPVYLYFHGGGFVFGTLSGEDAASAATAIATDIVVLNVNYRHTPEHTFPTAWYDSQDSFAWLHDHITELGGDPEKVLVGGVSAGGQLTASLVLEKHIGKALQGYPDIAGQILIIPCVASPATYDETVGKKLAPAKGSYVENKNAPILPEKTVQFFVDLLKAGPVDPHDTKMNVINATPDQIRGLPPTVFGIAGLDPLRDEGLLYAQLLAENGVPTNVRLFKGVPHGHRRFGPALKASKDWDECVVQGIQWALEKPKASGKFEVQVKGPY
ncbi:alpha/beta hydrolase fold-3 domain-containing protein [Lophiotrema nucula]|uniref:Alpha/beta hydrolase fold-3 domain-containing protein n=1 Tax=Lophiotrema nucula TaxID=690887 RepID=A0A6A5Z5Z7_9PLEO|nr:alpha/beta hydrolase fold-3 domain-containing protein [Lophiotrema nucula]